MGQVGYKHIAHVSLSLSEIPNSTVEANKKVGIEMIAIKESQLHTTLHVRWVNSDAQLANTFAKRGEDHQMSRFIALGQQWRIVYDANMSSGKRLKAQGRDPLQNSEIT